MNKKLKRSILLVFVALLVAFTALPVSAASGYKAAETHYSRDISDRTVNGTVFTSEYYSGTGCNSLKAKKDGKTKTITNYFDGGCVVSNGNIVYYSVKKAGAHYLYKTNITTGNTVRVRKLAGSSVYNLQVTGVYQNDIYYITNMPEGTFAKVNTKTKTVQKIMPSKAVSIANHKGKYILMTDGTGAGYSYLGVWNAAKNKFSYVSKKPYMWQAYSSVVVYTEIVSGERFNNPTIAVKRYSYSTGAKRTLVKSLKIKSVYELTSSYIKYYDVNGNLKTKKW